MIKYTICIFLYFLLATNVLAQDTTITWVSKGGNPIARERATYLRHSWQEHDSLWQVRDYFPEGGLQMSGAYSDADMTVKHGSFRFFAENGTMISEGRCDHNVSEGFWNYWHDNGNLMDQGNYLNDITNGQRDSIWNLLKKQNLTLLQSRESLKDSIWEYFHENGVRSSLEHYEYGMLTEGRYWNKDGSEVSMNAVVNRMPEYPGGEKGMMGFLMRNIKYPKMAKRKGIEGIVYISFEVDKEGIAKNFAVDKSVSPELDYESLRVVQLMPRWTPGIAQNRFVKVEYRLPIQFLLR